MQEKKIDFVVEEKDLAKSLGSGSLAVLGTPRVIAALEEATCLVAEDLLSAGQTSVGTKIEVEHLAPSALGAKISAYASLVEQDRRRLRFAVRAEEGDKLIAQGQIERFIVDIDKFMAKVN